MNQSSLGLSPSEIQFIEIAVSKAQRDGRDWVLKNYSPASKILWVGWSLGGTLDWVQVPASTEREASAKADLVVAHIAAGLAELEPGAVDAAMEAVRRAVD